MIGNNNDLGEEITEAISEADKQDRVRPDDPVLPVGQWVQKNLFSSTFSTLLTVTFSFVLFFGYRAALNFVFSEKRNWDAIRVNMRLLFSQAYPESHYLRVWISVALISVLAGLSLGFVKSGRGISIQKLAQNAMIVGSMILAGVLIAQPAALRDEEGKVVTKTTDILGESGAIATSTIETVRQTYSEAMADRLGWFALGGILITAAVAMWVGFGELRRRSTFIPGAHIALAILGLFVSTLWWHKWGHYGFDSETQQSFANPDSLVASTTRIPLTVIYALLVAAYALGRFLKKRGVVGKARRLLNFGWLLMPFVLYWVVLRDGQLDFAQVALRDLPIYLAFALGGGFLLWALTKPGHGEIARVVPVLVLGVAAYTWIAAYRGDFGMLQKIRLSILFLGLFGLVAPNFVGDKKQRMNIVWGWIGFMTIFHFLVTLVNTPSGVETPGGDFAGGFMVSLFVSVFTTFFSFPLGVLLALGRTSKMPIFRMLSTVYIEAFRGVPLITMLFFFANFVTLFLPPGMSLSTLAAVTIAFTLFSAAYLAENIRGGLQSIRRGQFEASDALGLTGGQRTAFIILPQALRVSIPPLVGQMIATYKETSLLFVVGIYDFLYIANKLIPNQPEFIGVQLEGLLFVSLIYWAGSFAMSKYSQRLEAQLGVGNQ